MSMKANDNPVSCLPITIARKTPFIILIRHRQLHGSMQTMLVNTAMVTVKSNRKFRKLYKCNSTLPTLGPKAELHTQSYTHRVTGVMAT